MGTLALYPNAASAAVPGGSVSLSVLFESFNGSGVPVSGGDVTITIAASGAVDGGTGTPVATTSSGIVQNGPGSYLFVWSVPGSQAAGSYLATWSGVRASDNTAVSFTQAVLVAALPASVPLPGVYATVQQYQAWSGDTLTPAAIVTTKLMRATEDIDVALVGAVYATDADNMPTSAALLGVLARATAAQCQYLIASNDDTGIKREFSSTNVGGVQLTRAASMQAPTFTPLCNRALQILHVEGVLPSAPLVNW